MKASSKVHFTIPEGTKEGQTVLLTLQDGRQVQVVIPKGVSPGTILAFEVEDIPNQDFSGSRSHRAVLRPTPEGWLDNGNDSSEEDKDGADSEEGLCYTSGEEDASGPRILQPSEWRARHVRKDGRCSRFRRSVRAYRIHYFHNQRDGDLAQSVSLRRIMEEDIDSSCAIETAYFSDMLASSDTGTAPFDRFSVGPLVDGFPYPIGRPVVLRDIPHSSRLQRIFHPEAMLGGAQRWRFLTTGNDGNSKEEGRGEVAVDDKPKVPHFGRAKFRVCQAFSWNSANNDQPQALDISGRLELAHYVRYVSQYPHADIPFYVFEDDIGGNIHTAQNYAAVDAWVEDERRKLRQMCAEESQDMSSQLPEPPALEDAKNGGTRGVQYMSPLPIHEEMAAEVTSPEPHRCDVGTLYDIPSLFRCCELRVPKPMRPTSTDGVFLFGSARTGSYPHVDPRSTSAWNWLLHGKKRWCLFPPTIDPKDIGVETGEDECGGREDANNEREGGGGHDDNEARWRQLSGNGAAYWWATQYSRLSGEIGRQLGMLECVQEAGELIFVPQGWWHAVLNVSPWTVALTHNLVMPAALPSAFSRESARDPAFARRWLACIRRFSPDSAKALEDRVPEAVARANEEGGIAVATENLLGPVTKEGKFGSDNENTHTEESGRRDAVFESFELIDSRLLAQ